MVTVVVGGQYGSEAKAKAAVALSGDGKWSSNVVGVRCGGPNAGHTIWAGGEKLVLRLVPSVVVNPLALLFICAGAMIDVDLLNREISELERLGVEVRNRLTIDPETAEVDVTHISTERSLGMGDRCGSTQTGTGAAAAGRALRRVRIVKDIPELAPFVKGSVWKHLVDLDESGWNVIVEGTQGYGLSLYHAGQYPMCTSKPAIASTFMAEAGLPPHTISEVVVVIRTYPIRVGGNSGPLPNEIDWDRVGRRAAYPHPLVEMTSVTKRVRRVGEFDINMVKDAIRINGGTQLAVHGLDYIDYRNFGKRNLTDLTSETLEWINWLEHQTRVPVTMAFTGPHQEDIVMM